MQFNTYFSLKRWFLAISLFIPFSFTFAQTNTLIGQITDTEQRPIPGVTIRLEGTTQGAVSETNGRYRLTNIRDGVYVVLVTSVGFVTEERTLQWRGNQTIEANFVLREDVFQSDEVVVTATKREQMSSEAPVSISIISTKEMQARNVVDLDEALRYIPGVQMVDNQVNIRGSSGFAYGIGSRVQFLVDGVPMLGAETGGISFNLVPSSQVKQVEVIKGPGSALYGGGALGGVINVITKDFPDKPETTFKAFSGMYPPVRYGEWKSNWEGANQNRYFVGGNISHARKISQKFGVWGNFQYGGTDGYSQNTNGTEMGGALKFGWNITPKFKWETLATLTHSHRLGFLYWMSARDALRVARTDLLNGSSDNDVTRLSVLPKFTYLVNSRLFFTLKNRFYGVHIIPIEGGALGPASRQTKGARYGSELQMNWDLQQHRYLIAGVSRDLNATESPRFFTTSDPRSQPESAVYAQYEQQVAKKLNLVVGARLDRYEISADETVTRLSPKINASYVVNPALAVRASWGKGFRVPGITERFASNSEFLPVTPNPTLRPEVSIGYEIGAKGFFPIFEDWAGQYDIAAFSNNYEDLVEPQFVPTLSAFQFVNLTNGKIQGIEANVGMGTKNGAYIFNAAYTMLDAKDLSDPNNVKPLAFRSKHLLKLSATLNPFKWVDLGVDYRFATKFEAINSEFARFVKDADLSVPTKVLDLRLGFTWNKWHPAFLVKNAGEYYYMERPAILAPTRNFIFQLQADL